MSLDRTEPFTEGALASALHAMGRGNVNALGAQIVARALTGERPIDHSLEDARDAAKVGIRLRAAVNRVLPALADAAVQCDEVGHPAIRDEISKVAADLKRAKDGMP